MIRSKNGLPMKLISSLFGLIGLKLIGLDFELCERIDRSVRIKSNSFTPLNKFAEEFQSGPLLADDY